MVSDLGLHCLLRPVCPNTKNYYASRASRIWHTANELANNFVNCLCKETIL